MTRNAASSRFMPRTTWAPAVRRIARWRRSAATIRFRCTASACRSAVRSRSTRRIWRASAAWSSAIEPALVSEHLAWSTHETTFFNDLLPLPYTEATLRPRLRSHRPGAGGDRASDPAGKSVDLSCFREIDDERDRFHPRASPNAPDAACCSTSTTCSSPRPIMALRRSTISPTFRSRVSAKSISPVTPSRVDDDGEPLLIDSHDGPVADAVWKLYEIVIARCGPLPTLIEWDSKIPGLAGPARRKPPPHRRSSIATRQRGGSSCRA